MSEARLTDLNYGRLGKPIYDSKKKKWCFTRKPHTARRLQPIGRPVIALKESSTFSTNHVRNAPQKSRQITDLTHDYPELAPAAFLLSDLAQTSEAVNEVASGHEPTASELLAFGEAIDTTNEKWGLRTVPVVALSAGAAGELVRIVRLTSTQLGWNASEKPPVNCMTAAGGDEGFWVGNGSPVQQLVFAEAEGKSGHWLAVRCHGAISIFRPLLLLDVGLATSLRRGAIRLRPSRLDVNHILTLSEQNSVPFSDVSFNPWNSQQFVTVDQESHWAIWNVVASLRPKQKGAGTILKVTQGHILEGHEHGVTSPCLVADGWGRVLWVGARDTIAVANRQTLAVFSIDDSAKKLYVPDLGQKKDADWLLDIKRSSMDPSSLFVATSSSVFWLYISTTGGYQKSNNVDSGVNILLSWKHFRDREDLSLGLSILDAPGTIESNNGAVSTSSGAPTQDRNIPTSLVMLYSRLSGLITTFTFHPKKVLSEQALSAADPYLLQLPAEDSDFSRTDAETRSSHTSWRISAMVLKAVHHDHPQEYIPARESENNLNNNFNFCQLSVLLHDSMLLEVLYAEVEAVLTDPVRPPDVQTRKNVSRTPAKIFDDFIMPDGFDDQYYQSPGDSLEEPVRQPSLERDDPGTTYPHEDQCSLSLEWLDRVVQSALSAPSPNFDEIMDSLYDEIKDRLELEDEPLETLIRIANTSISATDIDKAAADFSDFLGGIARITVERNKENSNDEGKRLSVSNLLTPPMQTSLGLGERVQISNVYDCLIRAWIAPLSSVISGRARIALEKALRDVVIQICFASYQVRVGQGSGVHDQTIPSNQLDSRRPFILPVRRRVSATNLMKDKEPAARSSPPLVSSQASQDNSSSLRSSPPLAQLTLKSTSSPHLSEPTSSLVESEDLASLRLKAYASLTPQPALPTKMSNLLGHWEIGADPASYDWEAAQRAFKNGEESEDEAQAKQRQRAEKCRKRQRKDMSTPSSQPLPRRVGGSQPQPAQETQSSSQQTQDMVIQSQVEPGRFGPPPAQAKKKKRKSGF